jgi:predicted nucleic acid-binding protein
MRIYLDSCCFNRPYDDQTQLLVRLEAEAKLHVQDLIRTGELALVWSYILDTENSRNPHTERQREISRWKTLAQIQVAPKVEIPVVARSLEAMGLKPLDALHVACAIEAKAAYFLTVDKGILRRALMIPQVAIITPIDFLGVLQETLT